MTNTKDCEQCNCLKPLPFKMTMAFQPIINANKQQIFAYEALVRGSQGQSAYEILSAVTEDNKYSFDQLCRIKAIQSMAKLSQQASLSINFLPNAIYDPQACLIRTLEVADKYNFNRGRIIFEVTEHEQVIDHDKLLHIFQVYRENGFKTAIDDFGEGFSGLNLLSKFQPDIIKIDMALVQGVANDAAKQAILSGVISMTTKLGIELVAEGVEQMEDYLYLKSAGISLMQGYLFAKPVIAQLPKVHYPQ